MVYLELLDIPRASIDSSREGVSWIQLAQSDDTLLRIAAVCINLQGQIEVQGDVYMYHLHLHIHVHINLC